MYNYSNYLDCLQSIYYILIFYKVTQMIYETASRKGKSNTVATMAKVAAVYYFLEQSGL